MVEFQPSKLAAWVRFPSPAPRNTICALSSADRVPGYEPVGRRFESFRARHKNGQSHCDRPFLFRPYSLYLNLRVSVPDGTETLVSRHPIKSRFLYFGRETRLARLARVESFRARQKEQTSACTCLFFLMYHSVYSNLRVSASPRGGNSIFTPSTIVPAISYSGVNKG